MTNFEKIWNKSEEELINEIKNGRLYVYDKKGRYGSTFFDEAVRYGTPAVVKACVEMGADVNCVDPYKARFYFPRSESSSLVAAMEAYNPGTLRALIECGARTEILNGLLWDLKKNLFPEALHDEELKAIKQRLDAGTEILKILREAGFNVPGMNKYDSEMSFHYVHPLYISTAYIEDKGIEYKNYKNVKTAVIEKKYVAWKDWDGKYADGGDGWEGKFDRYCEGVAEFMFEYSFPTHGTRPGALWHAISPKALKLMIKGGADVNATDAAGWTTMHHIIYHCDSYDSYYFDPDAMVQILIDNGADINAIGRYGFTPLMLAVNGENASMIQRLIEAGALKDADIRGRTPFMTSISLHMEDPSFFLDARTDVNVKDEDGQTALMYLAKYGCYDMDIVRMLIDAGADVNVQDNEGRTALEIVLNEFALNVRNMKFALNEYNLGCVEFIKLLIANRANPRLMALEGPEYLDRYERYVVGQLREAGLIKSSSYNFRDVLAENSSDAIVDAIKNGLDLGIEGSDRIDFLSTALRYGTKEVVQACVDMGRYFGVDKLVYPIEAYNADAVEILLKLSPAPNIDNILVWRERTNIFPEGTEERAKDFRDRLNAGAKILRMLREAGACVPNPEENLTYTYVCYEERHSHRPDGDKCESAGDSESLATATALRRAISPKALKLLIDAGADVNARGHGGSAAMHCLARDYSEYFDPIEMLKILIDAGADVNARDNNGVTPLMLLTGNITRNPSAMKAIKLLLDAGADSKCCSVYECMMKQWEKPLLTELLNAILEQKTTDTNLLIDAYCGSVAEIESALTRGANVNARSECGYTSLMFASAFNTKEAVRFLLDKGANVDARNREKETALMIAVSSGRDSDVVRELIDAGADVNAQNAEGDSPLFMAGYGCTTDEIAVILIKNGADFGVKNNDGKTALKQAVKISNFKVARALLAAGADPKDILDSEYEDDDDGNDSQ